MTVPKFQQTYDVRPPSLFHCRALSTSLTIRNESSDSPSTTSSGLFSVDTRSFFWHIHTRKKQLLIGSVFSLYRLVGRTSICEGEMDGCGMRHGTIGFQTAVATTLDTPFFHFETPDAATNCPAPMIVVQKQYLAVVGNHQIRWDFCCLTRRYRESILW